jgi:predicted kinase
MISLVDLLLENINKPKAIFLAGPAGSGKSSFIKDNIPNLKVINIDDTYEELLKKAGLDKPQSEFTSDELSQSSKLMGQARKATTAKLKDAQEAGENIVIDGTGAASNPILKKKNQLEELGYDTMMVMIYVSPLVSLERNRSRGERGGRSLRPSIIVRTWNQVNKNVDVFRNIFGNNFILVNNDPKGADKTYNEKEIKKYFDQVTAAREYSDEEKAKKAKEKQELESSIKSLLSDLPEFTPQTQIKSKINGFLS